MPVPSRTVSHGQPGAHLRVRGDLGSPPANGTLNISLTAVIYRPDRQSDFKNPFCVGFVLPVCNLISWMT